jgi:hypothetical protein
MKGLLLAVVGVAIALAVYLGVTRVADSSAPSSPDPAGNFDLERASKFEGFPLYFVGESFDGHPLAAVLRRADTADPEMPVRANFVSFIYGDCLPTGGSGCAPPLEVQVWPACERNPSAYDWTPAEAAAVEHLTIRGVPADVYQDGRSLEVSTGLSTVVIFGRDRRMVFEAAEDLEGVNLRLGPGAALPQPAPGAREGHIPCSYDEQ